MQLEQPTQQSTPDPDWTGTVPSAVDVRILGLVVVVGGLAASVNLPYGGVPTALAAFAILVGGGLAAHVLGERKLRRITDGLVQRWVDAGAHIEDVTRSSDGMQTEWRVRTPDGDVVIGGLALVPISRFSVEWQGMGDSMDASEAEENLDALARGLYAEFFEMGEATQRT